MPHFKWLSGLRLEERAAALGLLLLVVLKLSFDSAIRWRTYFTQNGLGLLLLIAALYVFAAVREARRSGARGLASLMVLHSGRFIRDWAPFVALIVIYENLLPLIGHIHPALYDRVAMQADLLLFETHPSLWLEPLVTRERTEWFAFFYLSLFALPIISGGLLYLQGRRRDFRQFLLAFSLAGVIGYIGYVCVPIIGPRYYFGSIYHTTLAGIPLRGGLTELSFSSLVDHVSHHDALTSDQARNCFPSLHTAWGLVILIFAYRQMRWLFFAYVLPVASLIFATLYLRLHYVVDVLAGALLAVLVARLAIWLEQRFPVKPQNPTLVSSIFAAGIFPTLGMKIGACARRFWPYLALVLLVAPVYISSLPTGITERNRGADGAELMAAALSGGTAHPPGYPLYSLLLRGVSALSTIDPIDLGHRLSSVLGLGAGLCLVALVRAWLRSTQLVSLPFAVDIGAFVAGVTFCFSKAMFGQALITEVYALHAAFVSGLLLLVTRLLTTTGRVRLAGLGAIGLVAGLAVSHHLTAVPLVMAVSACLAFSARGRERGASGVLVAFAGFVLGLLPWLYLPLAASQKPPLSWGQPDSWERFRWVVSAAQYRYRFGGTPADWWGRLQAHVPFRDAPALVLGVGTMAIARTLLYPRDIVTRSLVPFVLLSVGAANVLSSVPYDIRDLDAYFIPTEFVISAFVGLGVALLAHALFALKRTRPVALWTTWACACALLASVLTLNIRHVDAHGQSALDRRVRRIVRQAPQGALIAARGDGMVFGLWYEKFVRAQRSDLDIVSRELLLQRWYSSTPSLHTRELRWPSEALTGNATSRLHAVVRANYGYRPIVIVHAADLPPGCTRNGQGLLEFCDERQELAARSETEAHARSTRP